MDLNTMQCFIIFLVTIKQKPTESSCLYMRIVSCDVSFKRLCFSALRRTPRRAKGVEMKAESIPPLLLQTMSSQHIRDRLYCVLLHKDQLLELALHFGGIVFNTKCKQCPTRVEDSSTSKCFHSLFNSKPSFNCAKSK